MCAGLCWSSLLLLLLAGLNYLVGCLQLAYFALCSFFMTVVLVGTHSAL